MPVFLVKKKNIAKYMMTLQQQVFVSNPDVRLFVFVRPKDSVPGNGGAVAEIQLLKSHSSRLSLASEFKSWRESYLLFMILIVVHIMN